MIGIHKLIPTMIHAGWDLHLYEPDPGPAGVLREEPLISKHLGSVRIEEAAVADVAGVNVTMWFPDWSTNAKQPHPHAAFSRHVFVWAEGEATLTKTVRVTTLDEAFASTPLFLDLLKLDVTRHPPTTTTTTTTITHHPPPQSHTTNHPPTM